MLRRDYSGARDHLLKALQIQQPMANSAIAEYVLSRLARAWFEEERFEEEIAFLTEYIKTPPESQDGYHERATAFWDIGDLSKAINDYSRVIELDPTDMRPFCGRGQVFAELGKTDAALGDLDRALGILNTAFRFQSGMDWYLHFEAYARSGRELAIAGQGNHVLAMDGFETSLELAPGNAWVYYNRAVVHERAGDGQKAAADYATSLQKTNPKLNQIRREQATARLRDLTS